MAYINQADKKELMPAVKKALTEANLKGSVSISNGSTIVCKIKDAHYLVPAEMSDRIGEYGLEIASIHGATPSVKNEFIDAIDSIITALKGDKFFDHSDAMTDYFHTSHYIRITLV